MVRTLDDILSYNNNTGSVNLYMAYGGSNFQYWAGAWLALVWSAVSDRKC